MRACTSGLLRIACGSRMSAVMTVVPGLPASRACPVREHDRIIVHIDDPGVRNDLLGDFMHVALRRQARAEVNVLVDPRLGQIPDRALEEEAVLPDDLVGVRYGLLDPFSGLAVDGEVVLAA